MSRTSGIQLVLVVIFALSLYMRDKERAITGSRLHQDIQDIGELHGQAVKMKTSFIHRPESWLPGFKIAILESHPSVREGVDLKRHEAPLPILDDFIAGGMLLAALQLMCCWML